MTTVAPTHERHQTRPAHTVAQIAEILGMNRWILYRHLKPQGAAK